MTHSTPHTGVERSPSPTPTYAAVLNIQSQQQLHEKAIRNIQEKDKRKLNLIVRGLEPDAELSDQELLNEICKDFLKIEVAIESTKRLGKSDASRPQPIKVQLKTIGEKKLMLISAKTLKTSTATEHIYISPDYTILEQKRHSDLRGECKKRNENLADEKERWVVRNLQLIQVKNLLTNLSRTSDKHQ